MKPKIVEITDEDILRGYRGSGRNPAEIAFSRAYGKPIAVSQGPSRAAVQDRSTDHREWTAYLPGSAQGETVDYILPPKWQLFMRWWSYGPASSAAGYTAHVKPITLELTKAKG